jgi:hypothetical protein
MEKRKIDSLDVLVVGLGCNTFGWRIDAETTAEQTRAGAGERGRGRLEVECE